MKKVIVFENEDYAEIKSSPAVTANIRIRGMDKVGEFTSEYEQPEQVDRLGKQNDNATIEKES